MIAEAPFPERHFPWFEQEDSMIPWRISSFAGFPPWRENVAIAMKNAVIMFISLCAIAVFFVWVGILMRVRTVFVQPSYGLDVLRFVEIGVSILAIVIGCIVIWSMRR
jgi:hypothetical protein